MKEIEKQKLNNQAQQAQKPQQGVSKDKKVKDKNANQKKSINLPYKRDIILGTISLVVILLIVILMGRLNIIAEEIKQLENEKYKAVSSLALKATEGKLETNSDKIEAINSYLIDDNGLVDFVKQIDLLKEEGVVTNFKFASENLTKDGQTGYEVLPFELWFIGDKPRIDYGLKKLLGLPFLIRTVVVEVDKTSEEGDISLRYGGYLYVTKTHTKDR